VSTHGPDSRASVRQVQVRELQVREAAIDGIITPDAVVLELETAGVASRVCAGLIDVLVQVGMLFVVAIVVVVTAAPGEDESLAATTSIILASLVLFGYPVVCETIWRGRTIGKLAVGLRAVTLEGAPITARHAMLRMMGGIVDRFLPPGGATGMLMVLGTRRRQRIGDLLAGTIVIRDPERQHLPPALWFPVPTGYESFAGTIDPTAMTVDHYTVIRAFLVRVRELTPDARYTVATTLAESLEPVVGQRRPPQVHPETFLLCAIARYQRRTFPEYQPAAWHTR